MALRCRTILGFDGSFRATRPMLRSCPHEDMTRNAVIRCYAIVCQLWREGDQDFLGLEYDMVAGCSILGGNDRTARPTLSSSRSTPPPSSGGKRNCEPLGALVALRSQRQIYARARCQKLSRRIANEAAPRTASSKSVSACATVITGPCEATVMPTSRLTPNELRGCWPRRRGITELGPPARLPVSNHIEGNLGRDQNGCGQ